MGRLEVANLKNNEEFRNLMNQMSNDQNHRLEVRLTDLVNRLLSEQEERSRQIDDVRHQMDLKERMEREKGR